MNKILCSPRAVGLAILAAESTYAAVTIDYVTVGNAGNAADPSTGHGAVAYTYQIGKYEVTNAQYAEFLNAKASTDSYELYKTNGGINRNGFSGSYTYSVTGALANRPVQYVSWFDAARFANWLTNGQGSGDTENGSYTLNGALTGIIRANPANQGPQVYIPTEDEWYKAAYYNGTTATYSLYPNGQNSITNADANYDFDTIGHATDVGFYSDAPSMYGTFDQGGNVWEWNDRVSIDSLRGLRGGAWDTYYGTLASSFRMDGFDTFQSYLVTGFRVAIVPEPSAWILSMVATGALLTRRKR